MELGSNGIQNKGSGAPPIVPSGVLLQFPRTPLTYTNYRTGDEGDRVQTNWYDYTEPANPAVIAELDYLVTNGLFQLKNNLVVGGTSNKFRFTDIDGGQTFSAIGNKNFAVIDKLRGLMFSRVNVISAATWNVAIDTALAFSININGVIYDDWYLASTQDFLPSYYGPTDTITGATIWTLGAGFDTWSSTTDFSNTANAFYLSRLTRQGLSLPKSFLNPVPLTLVRKCINLITAP